MTKVFQVEEWQSDKPGWPSRYFSDETFRALCIAKPNQIVTDGLDYPDELTVREVVHTYRRRFKKRNSGKALQVRITSESGAWRWFARVIY